jgi:hypothetical protein
LESRGSDSLDFSEQAVWSIREALEYAYEAGNLYGKLGKWTLDGVNKNKERKGEKRKWD